MLEAATISMLFRVSFGCHEKPIENFFERKP
jgi:hypothetical protein